MFGALGVEIAHDWLDYVEAGAAVFAAIGTVGAVIWAMYGQAIRARQHRPQVELVNELDGTEAIYEADETEVFDGVFLRVKNAAGREAAERVEVFLSVFTELSDAQLDSGDPVPFPLVSDENLNFGPNDGRYDRGDATVPAGVSRRVYLARLGDPEKLFDSWLPAGEATKGNWLGDMCGAWSTVPARQDAIAGSRTGASIRLRSRLPVRTSTRFITAPGSRRLESISKAWIYWA